MNKTLSFCIVLFSLVFSSCTLQVPQTSQSQVLIYPDPVGNQGELVSSNPLIFLTGGDFVCRPRMPSNRSIVATLQRLGVQQEFYQGVFGIEFANLDRNITPTTEDLEDNDTTNNTTNREALRENVGNNWLKLGFGIANNSTLFLVIDSIVFSGRGTHGRQKFNYTSDISNGYCGTTVLYFVPPQSQIEYSPYSNNFFENLTIYISGLDIIDPATGENSAGGSSALAGGGSSNSGSSGSFGGGAGLVNDLIGDTEDDGDIFGDKDNIIIPSYLMKATLRGYFLTATGTRVATFSRTVTFQTRSSLLGL